MGVASSEGEDSDDEEEEEEEAGNDTVNTTLTEGMELLASIPDTQGGGESDRVA